MKEKSMKGRDIPKGKSHTFAYADTSPLTKRQLTTTQALNKIVVIKQDGKK